VNAETVNHPGCASPACWCEDDAGSVCDYPIVQLIVQFSEPGPNLGLVLARDLLAPPLAVRPGLEAGNTTPTPGHCPWVSQSRHCPE
jgi:hypothetical protein